MMLKTKEEQRQELAVILVKRILVVAELLAKTGLNPSDLGEEQNKLKNLETPNLLYREDE